MARTQLLEARNQLLEAVAPVVVGEVVVEGDGIVTTSTYKCDVKCGSYIHIRKNEIHRMSAGEFGIKFVEVQFGSVCDESDIVRLEDDYGRKTNFS